MAAAFPSRGSLHRQSRNAHDPPINHTRRSWTDNGVHYTTETASYASPGISFSAMGGTANGAFDGFFAPQRSRTQPSLSVSGALLGTAFNLLNDLASPASHSRRQPQVEDAYIDEEMEDDYDSDLAYDQSMRPRSNLFSRVKGKLADRLDHGRRASRTSYNREQSPAQRPETTHRQRSYRTETRVPSGRSASMVDDEDDDEDEDDEYDDSEKGRQRPRASGNTFEQDETMVALENTIRHYQSEVRRCKNQLERSLRTGRVDSAYLQRVLNELKTNEGGLASATRNLQLAKHNVRRGSSPHPPLHQSRPTQTRYPSRTVDENQFNDPFLNGHFRTFFAQPRTGGGPFGHSHNMNDFDPFNDPFFGAFHRHFATFSSASPLQDDFHNFFAMPGVTFASSQRKRPRFASTNSNGPRAQPAPTFTTFPPPPLQPPPTYLKPDEAKRLFRTYNDRWNSLSPTDLNIPYPTRGFRAEALSARDTLWAPGVSAHPSTWSEETAMQANAQAFFLGVVDMSPEYSEKLGTGAILMSFNKVQASALQVSQLVDILKKEKTRWHSDRLGRRNGGGGGTNLALQQSEKARAVFHAVCELMEVAQQ